MTVLSNSAQQIMEDNAVSTGRLLTFSGPSGAGKTTVLRQVFERSEFPLVSSVSATTRSPRPGEIDGKDYHFLTSEEFATRKEAGEFLECFEVYGRGHWYGTLKSAVTPSLSAGKWVVLEIDVDGTRAVTEQFPDAVTFFVRPSSFDQLEQRLRARATDSDEAITRRLEVARREWTAAQEYTHQVINDEIDDAVTQICEILTQLGD